MYCEKQRIALSFDKAATSYDKASAIQKLAGKRLLKMLTHSDYQPRCVLDIGCGTGAVTQQFVESLSCQKLLAVDMAERPLAVAKERLTSPHQYIAAADFDYLPVRARSCDLVISNMALQWSLDFKITLKEIHRVMAPGGFLAFTMPIAGTFQELAKAKNHLGLTDPGRNFNTKTHLLNALAAEGLKLMHSDHFDYTDYFDHIYSLLRAIKQTGATPIKGGQPAQSIHPGLISQLNECYPKNAQGSLPLSYSILLIIAC